MLGSTAVTLCVCLRVGLVACGVREIGFLLETTSGFIPIFGDSGCMSVSVYEAGFAGDIAPLAVFLRGFQALMRCNMAGMDQQEQFVAPFRKLRKFRTPLSLRRVYPMVQTVRRTWDSPVASHGGRCPRCADEQVHFPVVAQRLFPIVQTARRTIETSQLQYASAGRCPCCAVPQFSSADVEETVELPQLQLVFLRGHCRAHSRRCATTDAGWFRRHSCCDVARLISSWRR